MTEKNRKNFGFS